MLKLFSTLCFREALTLALTIIGRLGWALAIGVVLATLITSAARAQKPSPTHAGSSTPATSNAAVR